MTSLKDRISSPLEAGQSIHDAHHLPPHLTQSLEYVSKRLARKAHHVTLLVVRKDYQLPAAAVIPPPSPSFSSPPTSPRIMPSPSRLAFSNPASKFRSLVRSTTHPILNNTTIGIGPTSPGLLRSAAASPSYPDTGSPRLRWPLSPGSPNSLRSYPSTPGTPATLPPTPRSIFGSVPPTPRSPPFINPLTAHPPTPRTPATPGTPATPATMPPPTPGTPGQFSDVATIKLVYAMAPNPKADKVVRQTIEKAKKKFGLSVSYGPLQPQTLPADLLRRSLLQNEVLFSSEGITLLSLDRLYTFKAAVATYTRTPSAFRLEDGVDELRRLVLASRRRGNGVIGGADEQGRVSRSFLMRSYDFLGVSTKALRDVERAYARVYRFGRAEEEEKTKARMSGSTLAERDSKASSTTEELAEDTTPTQVQNPNVTSMPPPPSAAQPELGLLVPNKKDDIPEPMSPLKEPRTAPLPPSIHFRRTASPLPPTVSIPPTPIDGMIQQIWEQNPQSSPRPVKLLVSQVASPRHVIPQLSQTKPQQQQQQQQKEKEANEEEELQPAEDAVADSPRSFNIPIIIPSTATVNMAHRPKPSPLSPIDNIPIVNIPSPCTSPIKGPALKLKTTFNKSLPPLPLQTKAPRTEADERKEMSSRGEECLDNSNIMDRRSPASSPTPTASASTDTTIVIHIPSPVAATTTSSNTRSPLQPPPNSGGLIRPLARPLARPIPQAPLIKIDTSMAAVARIPKARGGATRWNGGSTIDSILCPTNDGDGFPTSAHPDGMGGRLGPMTPNGYDDISPITRGEWGMLMVGDGMKGRTAAVETW